jgi:hypothetical protein
VQSDVSSIEGRFPLVYRSKGMDNGEAVKIHNAHWHANQERSTKASMLSGESSKGLLSQSMFMKMTEARFLMFGEILGTHGLFSNDSILKRSPVKGHCSVSNDGFPAKVYSSQGWFYARLALFTSCPKSTSMYSSWNVFSI